MRKSADICCSRWWIRVCLSEVPKKIFLARKSKTLHVQFRERQGTLIKTRNPEAIKENIHIFDYIKIQNFFY